MTIAHVAALYRRNAKRRRKHGVKCKKISFSPFNEWASTNQLKLFFRENGTANTKPDQQNYKGV